MQGEFLRLLFLQAHLETESHFTATGMPPQRNQSDSFSFNRSALYQSLKSKVGLAAAKEAALLINLNVVGCGIVGVRGGKHLSAPAHQEPMQGLRKRGGGGLPTALPPPCFMQPR